MKTKEQVLEHLKNVGYTHSAITKIMGFLIGNGTKTSDEVVHYRQGDNDFGSFLDWYQSIEDDEQCVVCRLFGLLFDAMELADDDENDELVQKLDSMLELMLDIFVEDTSNGQVRK